MIQLYFTYDGTTLDLQANNYRVLDGFVPEASTDPDKHATDAIDVFLLAASATDRENMVRAINRVFEHARRHPDDSNGAYVYFSVDETQSAWRARLYDGVAALSRNWIAYQQRGAVKLLVSFERENAWEGPEAQLALTNTNGSNNTSGLKVYSCNDGSGSAPNKRINWVSVSGEAVAGDLPGKTRLELTNLSTRETRQVWIGQSWTNPTAITEVFEGEAGTGGTTATDSTSSGGSYRTVTPVVNGSESYLVSWSLSAAQVSAWLGAWTRAIVRFSPIGNSQYTLQNTRFRLTLEYGAFKLADYGLVSHDTGFWYMDMGGVRMPPWLAGQSGLAGVTARLYVLPTLSNAPVAVDYLALVPADGFQYLTTSGWGVPQNNRIVIDGIEDRVYADAGDGTGKIGIIVSAGGDPLQLQPGRDQRLYFLFNDSADLAEITESMSVKLFYRPRRLTL